LPPLIIAVALAVRAWCYTGPIGSDDHDYYLAAYEMHKGEYQPSEKYWKNRYGMILPIAAAYEILGTNEYAAAAWPMFSALGAVAVCYLLGKKLVDGQTGLLAALLLAFYPLDVHYSGLILPDIPISFLIATSVYAFIEAGTRAKRSLPLYFLSGLLLGIAYLCRSMSVVVLPFLALYIIFFERKLRLEHSLLAVGFAAVLAAEGAYYALNGLSPLYGFQLNAQAAIAVNSSGECSTSQGYYPQVIFGNLSVFGPYFYLFLPAMALAAVKRERGALILLAWAGSILFILQFGYVSLFPPIAVVKVRKFLIYGTVPLVLLGAWALMQVRARLRWSVVTLLVGLSLYFLRPCSYSFNRTPEAMGGNVRQVAAYLKQLPPKPIYTDLRTQAMLMLASGFEFPPERFRDLYQVASPRELRGCYVVINWFYARFDSPAGATPTYVINYLRSVPTDWTKKDFAQSLVLDVP
jgi:4-amino-4-deoxy-L-arabinose transferase-like glycosyltransferase